MRLIRKGLWCAHVKFTAPSVLAGMVSPTGVVDTQEPLELLIPDSEVSALLDAPTPIQHLNVKLASVMEAMDLDLLLDPHPSSSEHPTSVRAVASVANGAASNLLLITLQTGLSPRKTHQSIASVGAAQAAKKRSSDPQMVAASLQDSSMVRRATSVAGISVALLLRDIRMYRNHHSCCASTTLEIECLDMLW